VPRAAVMVLHSKQVVSMQGKELIFPRRRNLFENGA
jgi:hypothetical protein